MLTQETANVIRDSMHQRGPPKTRELNHKDAEMSIGVLTEAKMPLDLMFGVLPQHIELDGTKVKDIPI
ncbi:hypothetical protein BWQ96_05653 [Gracilariopsis chorda]|uniref:Uncharacterized protein n=1 Tax=Gracilariopsis chorda TaxID=448386 RepID=A0A2V3IR31_9FLOR|nr:hypothetical protein BWQ96_05653 [Gracilariopsis chorda]|eukprot:PXF44576.1 hypothetical protein BWQ96_05653 [Gracilariopsis chorda]